MKKIALICIMVLTGLTARAQTVTNVVEQSLSEATADTAGMIPQQSLKFGYLSYSAAIQSMPEYAEMEKSMEQLRSQYEAEQKRVEDDFNKKYEDFLDGQASFPKTILQKRQSELQEILDSNIAFKKQSQELLDQAGNELMAGLEAKLDTVLSQIGTERGYAFILNTDNKAVPYVNMAQGEDLTIDVKMLLNK